MKAKDDDRDLRQTLLRNEGDEFARLIARKGEVESEIKEGQKELKEIVAALDVCGKRMADLARGKPLQRALPFADGTSVGDPDRDLDAATQGLPGAVAGAVANVAVSGSASNQEDDPFTSPVSDEEQRRQRIDIDPGTTRDLKGLAVRDPDDDARSIKLPPKVLEALAAGGITTVAHAEAAIASGKISEIQGVGQKPVQRLILMIKQFRKDSPHASAPNLETPQTVGPAPAAAAGGIPGDNDIAVPADVSAVLNGGAGEKSEFAAPVVGEVQELPVKLPPKFKMDATVLRSLQEDGRWAVGFRMKFGDMQGGEEITEDSQMVAGPDDAWRMGLALIKQQVVASGESKAETLAELLAGMIGPTKETAGA